MVHLHARSLLSWIASGAFLLSNPACGLEPQFEMTVQSFDYSGSHPAWIAEAQRAAGSIFLQAGIRIRWLNCPAAGSGLPRVPDCDAHSDATHFVLVVLPEHMARRMATAPGQFGLAVLNRQGSFPSHAYVFLHRAVNLAKNDQVPWTRILGHLISHELGHLLLGTNSHFPVGIMRATWRFAEIKQALMGNLSFTPEQVRQLRADLQRRLEAGAQVREESQSQ
jgi:hypothetical protein